MPLSSTEPDRPEPPPPPTHRSTEVVRSSNRLSGFFNNLIHRREHTPPTLTRNPVREELHNPPSIPNSENISRSSSPIPLRSVTPPPSLPPPSLQELGLSLSEITTDLSPSHFTNPPLSGAFLAPHYLLLCHSQGLDVLPVVSPPAAQPYALIRRVSFKSVVVMEQRGVLIAIAGRRDGVRVYALEEVKRAIEWRIDVEVRRERERQRRENHKKVASSSAEAPRSSGEKQRKASLSIPPPLAEPHTRNTLPRKASAPLSTPQPESQTTPLVPRPPIPRNPARRPRTAQARVSTERAVPSGQPPPYASTDHVEANHTTPLLHTQPSATSINDRLRHSVSGVLGSASSSLPLHSDKAEWAESSDDEAIDIVAAGPSGSQALDERTSAHRANSNTSSSLVISQSHASRNNTVPTTRRSRPANLDLSLAHSDAAVPPSEPSPTPTLQTLRQTLSQSPQSTRNAHLGSSNESPPNRVDSATPPGEGDEEDEDDDGRISLAQALLESRIPDLPPIGTRRPQQPILISSSHAVASGDEESMSPRTSEGHHSSISHPTTTSRPQSRRRRWSVLIGGSSHQSHPNDAMQPLPEPPTTAPPSREQNLNHSASLRSIPRSERVRPLTASNEPPLPSSLTAPIIPQHGNNGTNIPSSYSSRSSRFIPRIFSNAFNNRRSDEIPSSQSGGESEYTKKASTTQAAPTFPPPKLEYVKLPGTKGSLMIKAVETQRKSFLAILCGDNGEKVELFAGTYRTALGLSRTFILPDSPKSLELQLQGDDLVEVFLVFSQNVFGLEPATVRVREVRIGRAERRAARRRARELRNGDPTGPSEIVEVQEEDATNVHVNVSVAVGQERPSTPALIPSEHPELHSDRPPSPIEPTTSASHNPPDEQLLAVATAQVGPYTTFQQLSFAPKFPLASIADDYIIPPTYPDFIEYRNGHEFNPNGNDVIEVTQSQFSPPGLPVPPPMSPSKWFYRDPKGVIHGPWKASLMQSWYRDGLLPLDLPIRREEDTEYILLRDLRLQSVDPAYPFRPSPSPVARLVTPLDATTLRPDKLLLPPISLLAQPHHFGPPALFYSSRGGHSTAIVDARGRSVLKGRFVWSSDDSSEDTKHSFGRLGDVKRLEAFDVQDRSVLVAMRQGGLEVVDLCDALLRPADESRTALPQFNPPVNNINRRPPFVWKIGTPLSSSPSPGLTIPPKLKSHKKQSTGPAKSPAGRTEFSLSDTDPDNQEEVLFLGRKDDEIYLCERSTNSFRILRLCPQTS
ncbi:hypothetical protein AMATHDRAFT_44453 [Amanita thiersii Skay4041]|uniref:GYF domain-containing protein n=1 Tax=Amanita thiersii Skay4041 TaxID=703135 RepID=A0A2A9NWR3_9AGAR|nr:hypothetical protein AMATHDRAFT_44453 [Amanita thiersii Skay4041]